MAPSAHDFESNAACAAMVASIRRGLIVGAALVAVVAIVIPVVVRPARLAASPTPALSRPASSKAEAVKPRPADSLSAPGVRDAADRVADSPEGAGGVPVMDEIR